MRILRQLVFDVLGLRQVVEIKMDKAGRAQELLGPGDIFCPCLHGTAGRKRHTHFFGLSVAGLIASRQQLPEPADIRRIRLTPNPLEHSGEGNRLDGRRLRTASKDTHRGLKKRCHTTPCSAWLTTRRKSLAK